MSCAPRSPRNGPCCSWRSPIRTRPQRRCGQPASQLLALGDQQERLIDALLTLASSERGIEQWQPFDLGEIAGKAIMDYRQGAERRGITIDAALTAAPATGDPQLADSLVANLVDNAIRHNLDGGRVEISTATTDGQATLAIGNTGAVIPPGEVDRLFQPFQRLGTERVGQPAGTGWGWPSCARSPACTARPSRRPPVLRAALTSRLSSPAARKVADSGTLAGSHGSCSPGPPVSTTGRRGVTSTSRPEDVGPVIVADRVEVATGRKHVTKVEVGDQGLLALPYRSGEDLAAGRNDDRVALFEPLAVLRPVLIGDELVTVREAGRDLVDVQDRVDADHEHAVLSRDVPHGGDPAVPSARVGASHRSTPCAYMWNRASGM